MRGGAQTYPSSPSVLAYFHVFFPELVLELLVLSLCKSALKTKESIKAQNKRNPSNPLKIFLF
jgi:hypothetical protein